MIVIADTTPIISLMKIEQLYLLKELFSSVRIPCAVFEELVSNPRFEDEAAVIQSCPYIQKVYTSNKEAVNLLRKTKGLDRGESEAIIYTDEVNADLLLMDELKGRKVARQMDIKVMGTLGILLEAYKMQLLNREQILECLQMLRKNGRQISEELYRQLIEKLN